MQAHDPIDLGAQEAEREESEQEQQRRREEQRADVEWVMESRQGRRFMWRLLKLTRVFHSSYSAQALDMAFNEGNRSLGVQLLNEVIGAGVDEYVRMTKENRGT